MEDLSWVVGQMPHRPPMRLIDEVVSVCGDTVVCRARITEGHILLDHGRVSPLSSIELFAQAAAAMMVYRSARDGAPPVGGYLLGSRGVELSADAFAPGDELTITCREVWGSGALAQLDCELSRAGEVVARGSVNVASAGGPP